MIDNETFKQKQNKPVKSVINFNNPPFLLNPVDQKGHRLTVGKTMWKKNPPAASSSDALSSKFASSALASACTAAVLIDSIDSTIASQEVLRIHARSMFSGTNIRFRKMKTLKSTGGYLLNIIVIGVFMCMINIDAKHRRIWKAFRTFQDRMHTVIICDSAYSYIYTKSATYQARTRTCTIRYDSGIGRL